MDGWLEGLSAPGHVLAGPVWSCHSERMRRREGLGKCLALEEGLGFGQGWRASEGEVGTLRLAGEGACTPGVGVGRESHAPGITPEGEKA